MGQVFIILAYTVAILTLIFSLVYLMVNSVELFTDYRDISIDLHHDIRIGIIATLILLLFSWFTGSGNTITSEIRLLSNSLKHIGLIWFSYSCLSAIGLLINTILVIDKTKESYKTSRTNIVQIMKTTGIWGIIILFLAWLFAI
jgi:hypothetical protein